MVRPGLFLSVSHIQLLRITVIEGFNASLLHCRGTCRAVWLSAWAIGCTLLASVLLNMWSKLQDDCRLSSACLPPAEVMDPIKESALESLPQHPSALSRALGTSPATRTEFSGT